MAWVPLHVHSQYSILDASCSVKAIAKKAKEFNLTACAITDHGNLYGAVEFFQACQKEKIKPLIGCELYIAPEDHTLKKKCPKTGRSSFHLGLIAKNSAGYHNLCKLSSIGFTEGFYYDPRVDLKTLKKYKEGLICLSGDMGSRAAYEALHGTKESLSDWIGQLQELFGDDLYLELCRHPMSDEEIRRDRMHEESWIYQNYLDLQKKEAKVNEALLGLGIKCVATNDSHYLEREDWQAHEILLNIASGETSEIWERDSLGNPKNRIPNPKRRTYPSHSYYFKSAEEMAQLFSDHPQSLANTLEVSEKCDLLLDFKTKHYPVYITEDLKGKPFTKEEQSQSAIDFLWKLCKEAIPLRYTKDRLAKVKELYPDQDPIEFINKRLEFEMSVIVPKEMCDYLLIVYDFINWAKLKNIPVGPGRGSGAGSIVLYLIGVTDIEPIRFSLFFERFINPERFSYPDIDVDICMDRRQEVINYTVEKYGKDNVAQIITFGTMKAKMTVKDVGRVLNVPLTKVNQLAKLIPEELNITLEQALEKDPQLLEFYHSDKEIQRIIDIGKRLEGSVRNTGIHAAGLVISGEPLTDHIPIAIAKDSDLPVTQFSMKPVEEVGMLKIDFLGLKTLTSIQHCVEALKKRLHLEIDWMNLPLDDPKTFELLNQGKTLGVFQMESGGMQDLAKNLHLDKFEEIIAVVSLYRPGPMEMIPSFIERKKGLEPIEIEHPWMEDILKETYGIMVYQEQVMQIASKLANYTLGEGDILRRAMGKKELDKMAQQREKFKKGCLDNGIEEEISMAIFDKMEKFASYGFNKSHAAAYAYITYVSAYLKGNYPKDWMASLMTCDAHDISKVAKFIGEAKSMGIEVLSPDINDSEMNFFATEEGIRFAMGGIKGLGNGVVETILEERGKNGRFKSFHDFLKRMDLKKIGKKSVELLVDAGCFSKMGWTKDQLRISIEPMMDQFLKEQKESSLGIMSLFEEVKDYNEPPKVFKETPYIEELFKEKELIGFFLTGHPLELYKEQLVQLGAFPLSKFASFEKGTLFRTAFLIDEVKIRFASKTQKKFGILTISDESGERFELPIWPDLFEEKGHLLLENRLMAAILQVEEDKISCRWIEELTSLNREMIEQCDRIFDKARDQQKYRESKGEKKVEQKKTEAVSHAPLVLTVALEKCNLSHILKMKTIFRNYPGQSPVELKFVQNGRPYASLHINEPWGVENNKDLMSQLKQIQSIE